MRCWWRIYFNLHIPVTYWWVDVHSFVHSFIRSVGRSVGRSVSQSVLFLIYISSICFSTCSTSFLIFPILFPSCTFWSHSKRDKSIIQTNYTPFRIWGNDKIEQFGASKFTPFFHVPIGTIHQTTILFYIPVRDISCKNRSRAKTFQVVLHSYFFHSIHV